MGYLLRLQPSSPIKAMKYFGIPAQTSRLTAGLGESRRLSSTWIVFRTTFSPRGSTSWPPSPLLPQGDTLGMSFMAEYLPLLPPPAVSQNDPVPLSPSFPGGSGESIHSFRPVAQPFLHVPSRSVRSVGGRSQLNPEPQEHTPSRSGRFKPSSEHGGRLCARGGLSPLSIPSSMGYGGQHDSGGGPSASYSHRSFGGHPPRSPPVYKGFPSPSLRGGSDS